MDRETMVKTLRERLGSDRVDESNLARDIAAGDLFRVTQPPACVVKPRDKGEVETVVRIAADAGYAIHTRGGGMSFGGGYAPRSERSITLDLCALNQVLEINREDMYVVVQPGCTWKALYEALKVHKLRVPAFGTRSGAVATIGGSLSQTGMMLGSCRYGATTEQVLGLEVVLGTGERVRTGQWAANDAEPFCRFGGPDLTGPFLGDYGAMGVKVEVSLRLIEWPEHIGTASFAFDDFETFVAAAAAIQRSGLAAEMAGMDETLQRLSISGSNLVDDIQLLGKLLRGKGVLRGLRDAASIAIGGKRFLDGIAFSLHIVTEARHVESIAPALAEIKALATGAGGREIPDVGAQMLRADPFPSMDQLIGPKGERWVAMAFMVPASRATRAMDACRGVIDAERESIEDHHIEIGILVGVYAPALITLTFVMYWPDQPTAQHRATVATNRVAQAEKYPANPQARAFLSELWGKLMDATAPLGTNYIGISGPEARYRDHRDARHFAMLSRVKAALDPGITLSPGAFGLG